MLRYTSLESRDNLVKRLGITYTLHQLPSQLLGLEKDTVYDVAEVVSDSNERHFFLTAPLRHAQHECTVFGSNVREAAKDGSEVATEEVLEVPAGADDDYGFERASGFGVFSDRVLVCGCDQRPFGRNMAKSTRTIKSGIRNLSSSNLLRAVEPAVHQHLHPSLDRSIDDDLAEVNFRARLIWVLKHSIIAVRIHKCPPRIAESCDHGGLVPAIGLNEIEIWYLLE
jgi:hypothetical protein